MTMSSFEEVGVSDDGRLRKQRGKACVSFRQQLLLNLIYIRGELR